MGAEAYCWITKYRKNLSDALDSARRETFVAGKFIGAEEYPATIEDAVARDPECGSGSLLDIVSVSDSPELLSVCGLSQDELQEFFGTERPSLTEIQKCALFWESFDRGEARAVTLYEGGKPIKICFAGWTIDAPAAGNGSFEEVKGKKMPKKKTAKPETVWGLWVNPVKAQGDFFPVVLKMSIQILNLWTSSSEADQQVFENGFRGYSETANPVTCGSLRTALNRLLELTSNGFYRYSIRLNGVTLCGTGGAMNLPLLDDPRNLRAACFSGGVAKCWMTMRYLEKDANAPGGYRVIHEEITDISDRKEVQLDDKRIEIVKKKINSLFDREAMTSLVSALAAYEGEATVVVMLGDIPVINNQQIDKKQEN